MNSFIKWASALVSISLLISCAGERTPIRIPVPQRPAGQQDMIGYADAPMDTVRVAIVGLGDRGSFAVYRYTFEPWCKITALCDVESDRVADRVEFLKSKGLPEPAAYSGEEGYKELCERDDVDLVYVCTDWKHHCPVALYAMEHGKHAAVEVPSANSLDEIWSLVNASEKYRRHCVILENCCYDFFELCALELAREGAFGEVVHAQGAYHHNLDEFWDVYWKDWRLTYNAEHRGDLYPTHGLGPVAQVLNINRGVRFTTLVAMDTKSVNGRRIRKEKRGIDDEFLGGDLTSTLMRTNDGRTVLIEHDVMTPRPYNRMYELVGTEGYAAKYPVEQLTLAQSVLDRFGVDYHIKDAHASLPQDVMKQLRGKVNIPILNAELEEKAKMVGGHGGMDWIMDYRLMYCLHFGLPVDMDVYDLASWCCLSELGSISMANGGSAVEIPDFTRGGWDKRDGFKYAFSDGSMR